MQIQVVFRLYRPCLAVLLMFLLAVAARAATDRSSGLLWEISGPGLQPSYIFGTVHSEDPEVLRLAAPVRQAFAAARQVVVEVLMDTDAMTYSSSAMLLMDGRLLPDIIGRSLFGNVAAAMQTRGIPEVVLERMKPWAAALTLSMPVPETGEVLDMTLYRQALEAGKPVHGLETIQEQLQVFDTLPEADQVALLRDAVANLADIDAMHAELLSAWKRRDLGRLMALSLETLEEGDQRLAGEFQRRLVVERNRLMVERMQPFLREGGAFVAIGALHLPGEEGVLNRLERQGYTLRAVY
ncbi:MAG: TraB/GumN family protein [Gammaproteobacteria bacterium]|jgi:uncharacterized protein YbaP (TraB family)